MRVMLTEDQRTETTQDVELDLTFSIELIKLYTTAPYHYNTPYFIQKVHQHLSRGTAMRCIHPASQSVRNIRYIARCSAFTAEIATLGNRARIIDASRVIHVAILVDGLDETISICRPLSPISDHLEDACYCIGWIVARSVGGLHQTGVGQIVAVCCSRNSNTAGGLAKASVRSLTKESTRNYLLHNDRQDESVVDK